LEYGLKKANLATLAQAGFGLQNEARLQLWFAR